MTKSIFTGGFFDITGGEINLYCTNKKYHKGTNEIHATRLIYGLSKYNNLLSNSDYKTVGVRCSCSTGYDPTFGYDCITLDPARVIGIDHLLSLNTPIDSIAMYLRYWGFIQIPQNSSNIPLPSNIRDLNLSEYCLMEAKKIEEGDAYYNSTLKLNIEGRRIFAHKKSIKKMSPSEYRIDAEMRTYFILPTESIEIDKNYTNTSSTIFARLTATPIGTADILFPEP